MSTVTFAGAVRRARAVVFLRHLLEMTVAMMVGMMVYGVLVGVVAGARGSSFEQVRGGHPELFVLGMALAMSVPMVAWMRRRGHSRRAGLEMSAAMFVPALVLIGVFRLGAVSADSVCPLACAAMIPAMVVAMLYRLEWYTHGG